MKDLRKLYNECVSELKHIHVDISNRIVEVKSNGRLRTVLGRCNYNRITGNYSIEINACLLTDEAETQAVKETIIHELIHTCPGCMNHGYEWKKRGEIASKLLGYNVCRLRSIDDLNNWKVEVKRETYKYALVCNECGKEYKRKRWSEALANPSRYRCGRCNGSLHTVCLDGSREIWAANKCK